MDTLEKAELTVSILHIARFLKSGIKICHFEVIPDTTDRKTRRREEHRQLQSVLRFKQTRKVKYYQTQKQQKRKNKIRKLC